VKEILSMRSLVALLVLAVASGCAKKSEPVVAFSPKSASVAPAPAETAAQAAPATNVVPEAPPAPALTSVSGKVLETIDASDYTYLRLKTANGETWAAVTKTGIKKGADVTVVNAMTMDGFESKTLKRKFDHLVFGTLAQPGDKAPAAAAAAVAPAAMASGHQPAAGAPGGPSREEMAAQHGQAAGGPETAADVKVEKATGPNAKTVSEVWAQRSALAGKEVTVKATVVKVTPGVLGKNWFHLRDGSGSKEKKDNDLTVTTDGVAKVGDVVTVSGLVSIDKDFGAGYAYPVIVENAKLGK
jgi:hypothetical protein